MVSRQFTLSPEATRLGESTAEGNHNAAHPELSLSKDERLGETEPLPTVVTVS